MADERPPASSRVAAAGELGCCGAPASARFPSEPASPSSHSRRSSMDSTLSQLPTAHHFSKFVLGCIDSYDSEKWRIFSDFSRSTRFSHFLTALNAKFQEISLTFSRNFNYICKKFGSFARFSQKIAKNDGFFVEILSSERCESVKIL